MLITNQAALSFRAQICVNKSLHFSGMNAQALNRRDARQSPVWFSEVLPDSGPERLHYFTFPPAVSEESSFCTFLPAFSTVTFFLFSAVLEDA